MSSGGVLVLDLDVPRKANVLRLRVVPRRLDGRAVVLVVQPILADGCGHFRLPACPVSRDGIVDEVDEALGGDLSVLVLAALGLDGDAKQSVLRQAVLEVLQQHEPLCVGAAKPAAHNAEIGRASCRERV